MQTTIKGLKHWSLTLLGSAGLALTPLASAVADEEIRYSGYYENATFVRDSVGLSKFRNTMQLNAERKIGEFGLFSNVSWNAVLRGSYDGVYDLNKNEYGRNAGGPVMIENIAGGNSVPHGSGLALPNSFDEANNPNEGMIVLGEQLHDTDGGVAYGVPVRPCDVDSRGCINGYLDKDTNDLRYSEFNDRLDFIRELYVDFDYGLDNGHILSTRLGKQQ
ncbi:MAG: hypothetical protein KBT85_05165, partial [Pseudomonas sp.]|nr:hypothetical protein [Pseudomonas sp.]